MQRDSDGNESAGDWDAYRIHVVKTLESIAHAQGTQEREVQKLREEIARLKVYAALWMALGSIITSSLVTMILHYLLGKIPG